MACHVYDTFVAKILYCGPKSPNSTTYLKVLLLGFLPASFFLDFNCYLTHLFLSSSEIQFYSGDNLGFACRFGNQPFYKHFISFLGLS